LNIYFPGNGWLLDKNLLFEWDLRFSVFESKFKSTTFLCLQKEIQIIPPKPMLTLVIPYGANLIKLC